MTEPTRQYIRHTINVPLEVTAGGVSTAVKDQSLNVSHGGLAFTSDACLDIGSILHLHIPVLDHPFEAEARVVWCRAEGANFLVGVEFLQKEDAFRSRMVEQMCTIEEYRHQIRREEGRELSIHQAGMEWIARYAGKFPSA